MRRTPLLFVLLALSLAANALLLTRLWNRRGVSAEGGDVIVANESLRSAAAESSASAAVNRSGRAPPAHRLWTRLTHGTLADLRRRLEAAGFPRSVIFELMMSEIQRSLGFSRTRSAQVLADTPYWRTPTQQRSDEEIRQWSERWEQAVKDAFGELGYRYSESGREHFERRFGPISAEKIDRLIAIENDYHELRHGLSENLKDPAEMSKQLALLDQHRRADIEEVLTPDELLEHDLRSSPARYFLTEHLHHLGMSEAEYRALFPAAQKIAQRHRDRFTDPVAARAASQSMLTELEPHARAILGEARFADYLQAIDQDSDRLNRIASRFDLPLSAAAQAAAAKREVSARADALRTDRSLAPQQRNAQLRELQAEAVRRINAALGPRAAEAYLSYDGRWLQQLEPIE